ncbi:MAG: chemotaxis response regulator protein-glutamate methylesterase [Leptospiraceae bacterium]|nr:chemotaxis response regulator protein-glutamate methylesterase [Leptospiraceae bacterium]
MTQIKVAIIDDSALVRQVLTQIVQSDPSLNVLFTASDPLFAIEKMKKEGWPDVIILDIEMPRMDGLTFLKKIMEERPTPVVICSSLTPKNSETYIQALSLGASEIVAKPQIGIKDFLTESAVELQRIIKEVSKVNLRRLERFFPTSEPKKTIHKAITPFSTTDKIVAIGTSTGGTVALEYILERLDVNCPGIVIVQHMPEKFTKAFAERLNKICKIEVKEAENMDRVVRGRALIAPGSFHMTLKKSGAQYYTEIIDGPLVNRHKPSVNVLFRSVAKSAGGNAIGIIMTGMGDDGADGIKEMHDAGAITYAQNEETCVVFGMPKEAIKRNAIDKIVSLEEIPEIISNFGM